MSHNRQVRCSIRWARYFNHYAHIPSVIVGGWAASRAVWGRHWTPVRNQAKHRFGERRRAS